MPLTLLVDEPGWRSAMATFARATPGLVPVIKGTGYGFGVSRLAEEAQRLGVGMVAVSDPGEVAPIRSGFAGDILVMTPWLPGRHDDTLLEPGVVRTVGHLDVLKRIQGSSAPVVVELLTAMQRHGIAVEQLDEAVPLLAGVRLRGLALHLPLEHPDGSEPAEEVLGVVGRLQAHGITLPEVYVSHLADSELARLARAHPDIAFRPRIGTRLWLGERTHFRATATVLDVRELSAGQRYGYRQLRASRRSTLLVVSGGTAHGIGLEVPRTVRGLTGRGKRMAQGALEAAGRVLSPYTVAGRKRWFAEAPHMQVSMVLLPPDVAAPQVGEEVPVEVRMTTTRFDAVQPLALPTIPTIPAPRAASQAEFRLPAARAAASGGVDLGSGTTQR